MTPERALTAEDIVNVFELYVDNFFKRLELENARVVGESKIDSARSLHSNGASTDSDGATLILKSTVDLSNAVEALKKAHEERDMYEEAIEKALAGPLKGLAVKHTAKAYPALGYPQRTSVVFKYIDPSKAEKFGARGQEQSGLTIVFEATQISLRTP